MKCSAFTGSSGQAFMQVETVTWTASSGFQCNCSCGEFECVQSLNAGICRHNIQSKYKSLHLIICGLFYMLQIFKSVHFWKVIVTVDSFTACVLFSVSSFQTSVIHSGQLNWCFSSKKGRSCPENSFACLFPPTHNSLPVSRLFLSMQINLGPFWGGHRVKSGEEAQQTGGWVYRLLGVPSSSEIALKWESNCKVEAAHRYDWCAPSKTIHGADNSTGSHSGRRQRQMWWLASCGSMTAIGVYSWHSSPSQSSVKESCKEDFWDSICGVFLSGD